MRGFLDKIALLRSQPLRIEELTKDRDQLKEKCEQLEKLLAQTDYLPVPPEYLRIRVGGWEDADHFLGVGRKIFWDLKRLLADVGKDFKSFDAILDFGCGCGRIVRFLKPEDHQTITGFDIDSESIEWAKTHLGQIAHFRTIDPTPLLACADESFDFIYCISVFTHLPESMQFQWLKELNRILKPQGILIASLHGGDLLITEDKAALNEFKQRGFLYLKGSGTAGLPDFYQTTFHTRAYVEQNWSPYFNILNIRTRAINNHQDSIVCQKMAAN